MSKRSNKIASALSYFVIIMLVIAVIGGLYYFTNGLTTDFKAFYLRINDKDVLTNNEVVFLRSDKPLKVETKYVLGFFNKDLTGYTYEIKANSEANFSYTVNGTYYDFDGDGVDYTTVFDVEENEKDFSLNVKADTISGLLSIIYPDAEIVVSDDFDANKPLFLLTVYSVKKTSSVTVGLKLAHYVSGVNLSESVLVF